MNHPTLRIIDANANRAREALRVLEDYARFALDDKPLCADLKNLRHGLAAALLEILPEAILHRDTAGDVGTGNKTDAELSRAGLADILIAAGKRLGEALRTLEEYLKISSPTKAQSVERLRYTFYDIELRVARTLRPAGLFGTVRLYVLITQSACVLPWFDVARAAIAGGADCLQLRETSLDSAELLRRARALVALCHQHNVLCIINDRPDIALLSDADGVHVGQDDLPATSCRTLLGHQKIIGVSTHSAAQAHQAILDGADYIGVGPVYPSPTKPRDFLPGLDYAREAAKLNIPSVAIAGITAQNAPAILQTGIRAIAVTSFITQSADPLSATRALKALLI